MRLQGQPAAVLRALLERGGELVTREELREVVWGKETNVDFEGGLNYCVAQLRSALGDSADSPVYVKTAPKRGYQFVAPVEVIAPVGVIAPAGAIAPVGAIVPVEPVAGPRAAELDARRARMGRLWLAAAIVVVGGAASYGWVKLQSPPSVRIAVARFENQTGDAGMDRFTDGLSDALVAELATTQLGTYQVIGNAVSLRQPRARQDLARIAEELRANYIVLGQVQGTAAAGRVLVHLIRLPDQAHLWVTRVENPNFGEAVRTQKEIAQRTVADLAARMAREGEGKRASQARSKR